MREIKTANWNDFCQRLTSQLRGAAVTIELFAPDGVKSEVADNFYFESMSYGRMDGCNDVIHVRAAKERGVAHDVIEPIHVLVEESGGPGDYNSVLIEAENGITVMTFHPAIHGNLLDGLTQR